MNDKLKVYTEYLEKVNAYSILLGITHFDQETIAPKQGTMDRAKAISYLETELFKYTTNEEIIQQLQLLNEETDNPLIKKVLYEILKDYHLSKDVPVELVSRRSFVTQKAINAWEKARSKSDFSIFSSELKELIDIIKEITTHINFDGSTYDKLLNLYEPGMNEERYDYFFSVIQKRLVPFIKALNEQPQIDDSILFKYYDVEKQKKVMAILKELLEFDETKLYLAESAHPFSSTITLNDGRITVRYLENSLASAIYSFIHEYGHALYGIQVNPEFAGTPLVHSMSMGMHESQSRLMENHIGRSKVFVRAFFEKVQLLFKEQLSDVTFDEFYKMLNVARCSLIRVEADELTYPLHILIRYEVEKAIFNKNIDFDEIKPLWNKLYKDYLGVDVCDDASGILQDIHFSMGSFGYFPTYALGSAFAAQFFETMEKQLDIEQIIETSSFSKIKEWLKENIHQYSSTIPSYELVKQVTGKEFDPNIYVDYLIRKYTTIYEFEYKEN